MNTKQAAVDWPTVLKLMGGGALLGGGTAAGATLVNYLSNLNQKAKRKADTARDDDILYLNLPAKRASDANSSATLGFGGIGSLLGAVLAYKAVRGVYGNMRRKQLQKELDAAQNTYLGGLSQSAQMDKSAANRLVGGAYVAGLLTILGSAIMANKVLQKQFPVNTPRNPHQPRKIVVRTIRGDGVDKDVPEGGATPDAVENMTRLNLGNPKSASWGLTDLVAAVAQGRGQEFKQNVSQVGIDNALDLIKGASDNETSPIANNLAISWIAHDPLVSNAIQPYLAAQILDDSPTFAKAASVLCNSPDVDAGELEDLIGLTEVVAQEARRAAFEPVMRNLGMTSVEKSAAARATGSGLANQLFIADALSSMMERIGSMSPESPKEEQQTSSAPASVDSSSILKKPRRPKPHPTVLQANDAQAGKFLEQNKDVIDTALEAAI